MYAMTRGATLRVEASLLRGTSLAPIEDSMKDRNHRSGSAPSSHPHPIAHGRDASAEHRVRMPSVHPVSEPRLQVAVSRAKRPGDVTDPYADVPCTD